MQNLNNEELSFKSGNSWGEYRSFLFRKYSRRVASTYFSYSQRFHRLLLSGDLSQLRLMSDEKRLHAMKALSCLSKHLGIYSFFKELVRSHDLKWSSGNSDLVIIRRLLRSRSNGNDVKDWIFTVKKRVPRLSTFIDFMVSTGLRKNESLSSYNLIIELSRRNRLEEYYVDQTLEHFRFHQIFLRPTKKAFISFVHEDMVERVSDSEKLTDSIINKLLQRRGIKLRFADIREYWASVMTRHLSVAEIDFLQGRVSSNVFMTNYFNPLLITDLKARTLKGIQDLL